MGRRGLSRLLDTAHGIGLRLAAEAFWHRGRCAWLGTMPAAGRDGRDGPAAVTTAALGPDLYGGTSGVALFLAHLAGHTADDTIARTARGAILHALGRAEELAPRPALGLYGGALGVALAAVRCGGVLDHAEAVEGGAALASALRRSAAVPAGHDLISGSAGAVVGLLALADELGEPGHAERAWEVGRALAAAPPPELTGMAHGAAGRVHALLELWSVTGDGELRVASARAVAYERALFDPPTGNWPDLRERDEREAGDVGAASGVAWCHGAPGVVLSRRRAREAVGSAEDGEIRAGLRTTERWVRSALATRPGNLSLCHGLAGNAEVLWECADDEERARRLALDVAELGAREYAGPGGEWPCGTPAGETPALMLGLAGIGLFHLRLHDPSIPSALAPGPRARAVSPGSRR